MYEDISDDDVDFSAIFSDNSVRYVYKHIKVLFSNRLELVLK